MEKKVLEVNVDDIGYSGVYSLVKNVILHKPQDLKIDIACMEKFKVSENVQELNKLGTEIYYIGTEKNKILKQFMFYHKTKKLLEENSYDCIHIHADVANKLLLPALAAKKAGVPKIILHSHASDVDGKYRTIKKMMHKCSRKWLKSIGTDFATCSELAAKWMFPNIPSSQIIMINNGVELEKFRYNPQIRQKMRDRLGIADEYLIGHVGRFSYQKNHEYLLEIFSAIRKNRVKAKLLLVGEGDLKEAVHEKAVQLEIEKDVIFYGTCNYVNELFQAMDIFVLPSRFEGLPIVGVEAQAAGLPVVFSDQITRSAKLLGSTRFLPIDENSINGWRDTVLKMGKEKRIDSYEQLKSQGFDLEDTINSFLEMYR